MINVNVAALVRGTLLGLEYMGKHKKGKGGHIINVASIYGLQGLSGSPIYCGTKHFVIGFSRSIGDKYYGQLTGVKVMTVCPGVTDTSMIAEMAEFGLKGFGDVGQMLADQLGAAETQS